MRIPVLIKPVPGIGFQARAGEPFAFTAEGPTREDALQRLREVITQQFDSGAEVRFLDVPEADHPWLPFAGMFKDDPLVEEWKQIMAERRREADAELELP
jgi:hypothetical protein